nr:9005_t:CDS:2 [Entrophospora candida]
MIANTTITKVPSNLFEELINEKQLNLYEYEQFNKIKEISIKEKCNKIYKAIWKLNNVIVTLKELMVDVTFQENRSILHSFIDEESSAKGTPQSYIDVYKNCWNDDPDKRPDINEIEKLLAQNRRSSFNGAAFTSSSTSSSSTSSSPSSPSSPVTKFHQIPQSPTKLNSSNNSIESNKKIIADTDSTFFENLLKFFIELLELSGDNNYIISSLKGFLHNHMREHKSTFKSLLKNYNDDSDFNFIIGFFYENSIGTVQDKQLAFEHYEKSAKTGNSIGQYFLGRCYYWGFGIKVDRKKAYEWLKKSADNNNFKGKWLLGLCYERGYGTTKDLKQAFELFLSSAENGNVVSQMELGRCYEEGVGTKKNINQAIECYQQASKRGIATCPRVIRISQTLLNEDRIVLNVGGIKYETYRSTLTAYPDTLLGIMFAEQIELQYFLITPTTLNDNNQVSINELSSSSSSTSHLALKEALKQVAGLFEKNITIVFYHNRQVPTFSLLSTTHSLVKNETAPFHNIIKNILIPYSGVGYTILMNFEEEIQLYLKREIPELTWWMQKPTDLPNRFVLHLTLNDRFLKQLIIKNSCLSSINTK